MTDQQHVPVEDLAAYAARDLDATASVAVEAHLVLCADCRADVDAVTRATAALAAVGPVAMPPEVAAAVDAALTTADRRAPAGDVLPMRRRTRPSFAGIAAVAAGVALVGAIAVPLVRSGGTGSDQGGRTSALQESTPDTPTRRFASGLNYTHTTVAATLERAWAGREDDEYSVATGSKADDAPAPTGAEGAVDSKSGAPAMLSGPMKRSVAAVQADPARLAACIAELAAGQPEQARVPVVVDFARYERKPAIIVALPTVTRGTVSKDTLDVFVAGPGCGTGSGGDVLDFVRVPRPGAP